MSRHHVLARVLNKSNMCATFFPFPNHGMEAVAMRRSGTKPRGGQRTLIPVLPASPEPEITLAELLFRDRPLPRPETPAARRRRIVALAPHPESPEYREKDASTSTTRQS